jgi:hypothetical protein
VVRGKSVRKTAISRINLPRDNTKLKIVNYLLTKNSGARRYEIQHKAGIRKQEPREFKKFLLEMCEEGWIKESKLDISGGIDVYEITENGRNAVNKAKELLRENHPLTKLHAFSYLDEL